MKTRYGFFNCFFQRGYILFILILLIPVRGFSQPPAVNWIEGPNGVDLGKNVAQLELGSEYLFAGAADTRKLMQFIGNPLSKTEVGLITQKGATGEWYMLFAYEPIGYIKDDEKEHIDADAILESTMLRVLFFNRNKKLQRHIFNSFYSSIISASYTSPG